MNQSPTSELTNSYSAQPTGHPWAGFRLLTWYSFWKILMNPYSLGFALALPLFMYFMFGTGQKYSDISVGNGNVAASVLLNMTLYGTIMTTSSLGANIALERTYGISRLFAMTPISPIVNIFSRLCASVGISSVVITVTFSIGKITGSTMTAHAWLLSALFITLSSALPAILGIAVAFTVRSDSAFAAASAVTVFGSFASGMFMPLENMGTFFQNIAPWTPFYGIQRLVALPIYGFDAFQWDWLINVLAWIAFFLGLATWAQRRDTAR